MAPKIKGIYKSLKFITKIFVVKKKKREIEIGYPTDVKHVAHIGLDAPPGIAPSWMNEFKTDPDFTATSIDNNGGSNPNPLSTWSSQDFEQSMGFQAAKPSTNLPNSPKKQKRKKKTSSPKFSSSKSSRASKTKATYTQLGS